MFSFCPQFLHLILPTLSARLSLNGGCVQVTVEGLKGLRYSDNANNLQEHTESQQAVSISGETDRIYQKAPDTIVVSRVA